MKVRLVHQNLNKKIYQMLVGHFYFNILLCIFHFRFELAFELDVIEFLFLNICCTSLLPVTL